MDFFPVLTTFDRYIFEEIAVGKYQINSRIWVGSEKGMLLGEGRIALLREIEKNGSISKAAKAMDMSYKKAWRLVDEMNRNAKQPLVQQKIGGKGGGGTVLSEAGINAIRIYTELQEKERAFLREQESWLQNEL
ncbi:MAG: LysR family transcriptional regulator [bacterium]|nr:LysR family transcriptional regulator [bacterium]